MSCGWGRAGHGHVLWVGHSEWSSLSIGFPMGWRAVGLQIDYAKTQLEWVSSKLSKTATPFSFRFASACLYPCL